MKCRRKVSDGARSATIWAIHGHGPFRGLEHHDAPLGEEFKAFDAVARRRDISRRALLRQVVREFMATIAKEP